MCIQPCGLGLGHGGGHVIDCEMTLAFLEAHPWALLTGIEEAPKPPKGPGVERCQQSEHPLEEQTLNNLWGQPHQPDRCLPPALPNLQIT